MDEFPSIPKEAFAFLKYIQYTQLKIMEFSMYPPLSTKEQRDELDRRFSCPYPQHQ